MAKKVPKVYCWGTSTSTSTLSSKRTTLQNSLSNTFIPYNFGDPNICPENCIFRKICCWSGSFSFANSIVRISPSSTILFTLFFWPSVPFLCQSQMLTTQHAAAQEIYFLLNTIWYVCFLADFAVVPRCWDRPGISPASRLPPTIPGILFHQQPIFGQTFIFLENIIQPSILPFPSGRYLQQMTRYWFVEMNLLSLTFWEDSHKNTHIHLRIDVWLVIEWILRIEWKEERNNERDRKDHRGWKDLRDHH